MTAFHVGASKHEEYILGLISTYKTGRRTEGDMFTLSDVFQSPDWHQLSLQHHSASVIYLSVPLCNDMMKYEIK